MRETEIDAYRQRKMERQTEIKIKKWADRDSERDRE